MYLLDQRRLASDDLSGISLNEETWKLAEAAIMRPPSHPFLAGFVELWGVSSLL